jgi:hypothetical protein
MVGELETEKKLYGKFKKVKKINGNYDENMNDKKQKKLNFERSGIFNIRNEKYLKQVNIKVFNVGLLLSWASFFSKKIKITELHFAYILLLREISEYS